MHGLREFNKEIFDQLIVFTITERILAPWLVESYGVWEYRPKKWRDKSRSARLFCFWNFVKKKNVIVKNTTLL